MLTNLSSLDLSENAIQGEGVAYLRDAIRESIFLKAIVSCSMELHVVSLPELYMMCTATWMRCSCGLVVRIHDLCTVS